MMSASSWSIACTSAASPVSVTMKYGLVSAWSALKIDVSCTGSQTSVHEGERCYLSCTKVLFGSLPAVVCDLPCWLGDERGERKPVIVLVFLEICKRDEEKSIEFRGVLVLDDAGPHLQARG